MIWFWERSRRQAVLQLERYVREIRSHRPDQLNVVDCRDGRVVKPIE